MQTCFNILLGRRSCPGIFLYSYDAQSGQGKRDGVAENFLFIRNFEAVQFLGELDSGYTSL